MTIGSAPVTRRAVIVAAGAAGAAGLAPAAARAALPQGGDVFVDPAVGVEAEALAGTLGRRVRPLERDIVRQWRSGLAAEAAGGVAVARWSAALMLAGLARESGLAVRQDRIGPSLFVLRFG